MRRAFEEELNQLHEQFYQMGLMVSESIYQSVKGFTAHDKEMAEKVVNNDHHINEQQVMIETKSIELIALQQPVTSNLRRIITIMKACADLERMGDHAVNVAKATIRVKGNKKDLAIENDLAVMAEKVKKLVERSLTAFIETDVEEAKRIALKDDEIDQMAFDIHKHTLDEMKNDPELVLGATNYILVAGNLERISDYVTNLCEWIIYLESGKITELNTHNTLDNTSFQ
ncbi:phosphate uptake regulator, PhoU [Alkalibacterium putridalgicola]|jgi:phosphate transport system protein|uniref:Phosphate-specific transport system accessory protein PhoU n=1 Tax=Alkalibacterium putridalgicola TaxID=426703 RepID=A0A1H7RII5_9LACT|nr:phosphate signaling complex protein PhoU [Alkalibacterium putridalgicola]GEK88867.1 phosphate transport system regulatory protein PhoU [Alkalibacterium putridalgicola]SEL60130.1 phosphate uptake regulator, PhoU [Alkalibacterium putridalgicola]